MNKTVSITIIILLAIIATLPSWTQAESPMNFVTKDTWAAITYNIVHFNYNVESNTCCRPDSFRLLPYFLLYGLTIMGGGGVFEPNLHYLILQTLITGFTIIAFLIIYTRFDWLKEWMLWAIIIASAIIIRTGKYWKIHDSILFLCVTLMVLYFVQKKYVSYLLAFTVGILSTELAIPFFLYAKGWKRWLPLLAIGVGYYFGIRLLLGWYGNKWTFQPLSAYLAWNVILALVILFACLAYAIVLRGITIPIVWVVLTLIVVFVAGNVQETRLVAHLPLVLLAVVRR